MVEAHFSLRLLPSIVHRFARTKGKYTMYFVVSTGRSGTKTLATLLSLTGGCVCMHEPFPQLIMESSAYRYGTISDVELLDLLRETRSPHVDGSIYCESNQTLSLIIPLLSEAFPEARFLWLIRNGLDMVASAYAKQWYSGHSENHDRYEDCPPIERAWIDGRIRGDQCGDMSPDAWRRLDRFRRCCWYWDYVNRTIEDDLTQYAANRFELLRLEDLNERLPELLSWMGLKATITPVAKRTNVGKRKPYPWTEWSDAQRAAFEATCGELMDRLYPAWRTAAGQWAGIPYSRPASPIATIASMHRLVKWANVLLSPNRSR
jgi:hypothetical protein